MPIWFNLWDIPERGNRGAENQGVGCLLSPPRPSYFNVQILNSNRQLPDELVIE